MKLIFLILFNLTGFKLQAMEPCSVELYSKVYRLESAQTLNASDVIYKSDCSPLINNKISQAISNSDGVISAEFLTKEISRDAKVPVIITPRKIALLDLNSTMRDQLLAGSNLYFLNSKSLNGLRSLGIIEGEQISTVCESCQSFGEKNIKIDVVNPLANTMRSVWFTSKIMAKMKVYKAKRNISFQQKSLSLDDFYSDEIYSQNPENVLTTLERIHFYKSNKTLLQGQVVNNIDLQAVNLINYGTPVSVVLKSQSINLQRTAMPTRSAQFGETIELRNPSNNKTIAGKVVDYNKVVIEL